MQQHVHLVDFRLYFMSQIKYRDYLNHFANGVYQMELGQGIENVTSLHQAGSVMKRGIKRDSINKNCIILRNWAFNLTK